MKNIKKIFMSKGLTIAILNGFLMSNVFAAGTMEAAPPPSSPMVPEQPQAEQTPTITQSPETDKEPSKGKKKILDLVRKGVVMIKVNSYADIVRAERSSWAGTGFIVDREKGIIATNHHVAGEMSVCTYNVKFFDGTSTEAHVVPLQTLADFAFIKVDPKKLPEGSIALEFSDQPITVNQSIYAMGNAALNEFSTFKGTVFSVYENLGPYGEQSFQFSGLTVGGASGSPVFSADGKVVGILYGGAFVAGTGIPIAYVADALKEIQNGRDPKFYSTGAILSYENLSNYQEAGLLPKDAVDSYLKQFPHAHNKIPVVNGKILGTDAAQQLQIGDMVWSINGTVLGPELYIFERAIHQAKGGDVKVQVYREGKLLDLTLKSYEIKPDSFKKFISFGDTTWFETNEYVRYMFGDVEGGVFILGMGPTSPFNPLTKTDGRGMHMHFHMMSDRLFKITQLDGKPIKSLEELKALIPILSKKKTISVKYIDYSGSLGLGAYVSKDRQEKLGVISYEAKFDSPKYYQFNDKAMEWDTKELA